jgi:hypothetical protein
LTGTSPRTSTPHSTGAITLRRHGCESVHLWVPSEYRGEPAAYDGFDDFLRVEFPKRHQGWEPRFGPVTWFHPDKKRYEYLYLISGSVPGAESQADAEHKVEALLRELAREFKALRPSAKKVLREPATKVWRWHPQPDWSAE